MGNLIMLIFAMSTFMWYIIDKFKDIWSGHSFSRYITIAVSALFAFGLSFGFNLDIVYALGLVEAPSIVGTILTGLTLMSGSSAVAEIMETIQGSKQ